LIRSQYIRPLACLLAVVILLGTGCAYFNMFYNAQAAYREGMKLKDQNQKSLKGNVTISRTGGAA